METLEDIEMLMENIKLLKGEACPMIYEAGEVPKVGKELTKTVFSKYSSDYNIVYWDLDNIFIESDKEEFQIRMWDMTEEYISWTLFKSVGSCGEPIESGTFYIKN